MSKSNGYTDPFKKPSQGSLVDEGGCPSCNEGLLLCDTKTNICTCDKCGYSETR